MSKTKRYLLFLCGLFFVALGISCAVKSHLGTAPISSPPYILSSRFPLSLGSLVFTLNILFFVGQLVILKRKFPLFQWLQIPMTGIFGFFIDFTMLLLSHITPTTYLARLAFIAFGVCSMGFGIALEMIGNVVILPGEGIVKVIASQWSFDFGRTKTFFDTSLVLLAAGLSCLYFGEIRGVREGTLIFALATGTVARFFMAYLHRIPQIVKSS